MERGLIEGHNKGFKLELFEEAQEKTKQAVCSVVKKVVPGMRESEAYKLMAKELLSLGSRKFWHPIHIRFGENTLLGYKEKEEKDPVLKENDIFFFDIGPIFNQHEADFGVTYQVGSDPLHKKAVEDVQSIFDEVKRVWKEKGLTGLQLWKVCEEETEKRGWILNPTYVRGHRISTFPHNLITKTKMADLEFSPGENIWILEVQIQHPKLPFGAFYEDVL